MRAVVFAGAAGVRVEDVPEPSVQDPSDAIVRVTQTSICGSDLHLLDGKTPGMRVGATIGHEFVGTVHDPGDTALAPGARVLGSFLIACGECDRCIAGRFNHCTTRRALGLGPLTGDLDGAEAELVRIPGAGFNLRPLDDDLGDEAALFAGDVLSTGFYAASLGEVADGQTVAVIGGGPVGLFTALAARARGARALLLDTDSQRVGFAADTLGLEAVDVSLEEPFGAIAGRTDGRMADVAVDAVGAAPAFKAAMKCARDGGRVVVVGVYGSERYELPMGMVWVRGLDLRFSGMANIHAHWDEAIAATTEGKLDPTSVITHRMALDDAVEAYELFASRRAVKVVLTP